MYLIVSVFFKIYVDKGHERAYDERDSNPGSLTAVGGFLRPERVERT